MATYGVVVTCTEKDDIGEVLVRALNAFNDEKCDIKFHTNKEIVLTDLNVKFQGQRYSEEEKAIEIDLYVTVEVPDIPKGGVVH